MTTRDYTANVISATKVVPDGNFKDSKASGVWDINEALDLIKGGNWPNVANINPAAFVNALFSTFVYQGDGNSNRDIVNGINLSDNGGLVWLKSRGTSYNHYLNNPSEFTGYAQIPSTSAWTTSGNFVTNNNNGFRIPVAYSGANATNSTQSMVAWTFRKQPKFFDIVTYNSSSGNVTNFGSAGATVNHNLGSVPGMIIVKCTDTGSTNWKVYHRGLNGGTNPEEYEIELNQNGAQADTANSWNDTAPTSTQFTLGSSGDVNNGSRSYVAYLFAHNNDDGGFGEPGDQDIIKCGTYTGNAGNPQVIDVGFEPQFLMVKAASTSGDWYVVDNMRGVLIDGDYPCNNLYWNKADAEELAGSFGFFANGFTAAQSSNTNGNGVTFIYMAIRRGGMQTPSTPSDVFHVQSQDDGSTYSVGFPTDLVLINKTGGSSNNTYVGTRLTGDSKFLKTAEDSAQASSGGLFDFDLQNSFDQGASTSSSWVGYHWARARGFCDVVAYTGTGSATTIAHNLGAVPEMMWFKRRNTADIWTVYHAALGEGKRVKLHTTDAAEDDTASFNNTAPTSSVFSIGTVNQINASGSTYLAFLFATVAGVSKVGSYTGDGSTSKNIDCGFTNGAKFVLIRRTDDGGGWIVFDAERGLSTAAADPFLYLDSTGAQSQNVAFDLDPNSSGFTLGGDAGYINASGGTYIFYAIANDPS